MSRVARLSDVRVIVLLDVCAVAVQRRGNSERGGKDDEDGGSRERSQLGSKALHNSGV